MTFEANHLNAPVLVTMELRHPPDSLTESSREELKRQLIHDLPIERQAQDVAWAMGPGGQPAPTAERFLRYVNRDNTVAASFKANAVVIESTAYSNFESWVDVVTQVVDARSRVSPIVGVERIGLRYLLELRGPVGADGRVEWSNSVAEPLLGPRRFSPGRLPLADWQGAAVYREAQPGKSMIVRYGTGTGQALDPSYHLRRTVAAQPGPFFLLDIDSFWTPPAGIPEYDRGTVLGTFRELYEPARDVSQEMVISRPDGQLLRS